MKFASEYYGCAKTAPYERQQLNDEQTVEIYEMNDTEVYNFAISHGNLSLWTSLDGKTYRLYVEKEYYENFKELHNEEINKVWVNYFNKSEKVKFNYTMKLMYPILLLYIVAVVLLIIFFPQQSWIVLVGLLGMLVLSSFGKASLRKKRMALYYETIESIKSLFGEERFNELLESQEKFRTDYFTKLYHYDEETPNEEENAPDNETKALENDETIETVDNTDNEIEVKEDGNNE